MNYMSKFRTGWGWVITVTNQSPLPRPLGNVPEENCLQGSDTVLYGTYLLTLQGNTTPSSSDCSTLKTKAARSVETYTY
jgi:hypothetical protein